MHVFPPIHTHTHTHTHTRTHIHTHIHSTYTHHTPAQDVVTRYAHQSGFHVDRRFGWDCHGLPVEYEIDKTLGIKVK